MPSTAATGGFAVAVEGVGLRLGGGTGGMPGEPSFPMEFRSEPMN